ncbi:MAG: PilZ domain-containing protein, partial [Phycisphaerales bacterium]
MLGAQQNGRRNALTDQWRGLKDAATRAIRQFTPAGDMPEEQAERRTHARRDVATAISLIEIDDANAPIKRLTGAVLNVSKKGMCVLVDEAVPKNRSVMLDFAGRSDTPGRSILARVTRIQRARGQQGFVLGLKTESC